MANSSKEVIIDSVSINHLLRNPHSRPKGKNKNAYLTCLDPFVEDNKIIIVLDAGRGLLSEWEATCGIEKIGVLISKWEQYRGIFFERNINTIDRKVAKSLRQLGFNDATDKLILKIAIAKNKRNIISDDSDFWDPSDNTKKGCANAIVTKLIRDEFGIIIMLVSTLLNYLKKS